MFLYNPSVYSNKKMHELQNESNKKILVTSSQVEEFTIGMQKQQQSKSEKTV